ncbi:hypothetical protein GCM10007885_11930 [Methylobacterium gnaphalii]|nr:hypothetical protein GCM10007885_11930 [Methylobacterium gnaphalii]
MVRKWPLRSAWSAMAPEEGTDTDMAVGMACESEAVPAAPFVKMCRPAMSRQSAAAHNTHLVRLATIRPSLHRAC